MHSNIILSFSCKNIETADPVSFFFCNFETVLISAGFASIIFDPIVLIRSENQV